MFWALFFTIVLTNLAKAIYDSNKRSKSMIKSYENSDMNHDDDQDYHYDESAEKLRRDPAAYASRVRQDSNHKLTEEVELTEEDHYFANIAEHERQFELSGRNNQA